MNQIKVSIIIPYYNNVPGIRRLVDSIGYLDDVEIIIVNDHSKSIYDLINEYNWPNLKYYEQTKGYKWAGAARNLALSYAKGEFLLFADSDDYFCQGWYEIIKRYFDLNYDLVYFSPDSAIEGSSKRASRHLRYQDLVHDFLDNSNDLIRFRFHVPWSKLIKRSLVVNYDIKFDEVIASNDVLFSLKVGFYAKEIHADLSEIYCVTESSNSLTKQVDEAVLDSRFDAAIRFNEFLIAHKDYTHLTVMSGHLKNSLRFGVYKFLYRFFYCKYRKYPIFHNFSHVYKVIKRDILKV